MIEASSFVIVAVGRRCKRELKHVKAKIRFYESHNRVL